MYSAGDDEVIPHLRWWSRFFGWVTGRPPARPWPPWCHWSLRVLAALWLVRQLGVGVRTISDRIRAGPA
jgi:hypothetical protein